MDNALHQPQTIVLLGGTSDIGLAIVARLLSPAATAVVLACRNVDAGEREAQQMRRAGLSVEVVAFDAADPASHAPLMTGLADRLGDLDVVVLAAGLLGDGDKTTIDPVAAAEVAQVDFTGSVSVMVATTNVLRAQGHGSLVVLSSVAGERVRAANPVYGGAKAGLDGVAQGLGDRLAAEGVHVLVVRPGFVHSSMTAGMDAAPFATTPDKVAEATAKGLRNGKRTVWAPGVLRYVFSVLRHVPAPIWRRLPLG